MKRLVAGNRFMAAANELLTSAEAFLGKIADGLKFVVLVQQGGAHLLLTGLLNPLGARLIGARSHGLPACCDRAAHGWGQPVE
jgi:hypothetical protein